MFLRDHCVADKLLALSRRADLAVQAVLIHVLRLLRVLLVAGRILVLVARKVPRFTLAVLILVDQLRLLRMVALSLMLALLVVCLRLEVVAVHTSVTILTAQ